MSEESFRDFVLADGSALLRSAWMLTGDADSAQDLLQSALVKTWPHWARISTSAEAAPKAYVRQVMVRTYSSWWRRRWRDELATAELPESASVSAEDGWLESVRLRTALAQLPARQRAVVVLRFYEDYSEQMVAQALGCSVGTVKSQAAKGLAKLRVALHSEARQQNQEIKK